MVELLLAMERIGVRFPLAAPDKNTQLILGIFVWILNKEGLRRVEGSTKNDFKKNWPIKLKGV